jgi:hypothetical protein
MAFVSQPDFVPKILKALGLDVQKVRGLSLHMHVNDLVRADVSILATSDQMDGVAEALETKRYVLVPANEKEEFVLAPSPSKDAT